MSDPSKEHPHLSAFVKWAWDTEAENRGLRDMFAAHALQGILANPQNTSCASSEKRVVQDAYSYADAMLAARAEKPA